MFSNSIKRQKRTIGGLRGRGKILKLQKEEKKEDINFIIFDSKAPKNNINKEIKTNFKCDVPNISYDVLVFNNKIDMDNIYGKEWRLSSSADPNNPTRYLTDENIDKDKRKIVILMIDGNNYLGNIDTTGSGFSGMAKHEDQMSIDYINVKESARGKGLSKQLFNVLFAYLNTENIKKEIILLQYEASHEGALKLYTDVMGLNGFEDDYVKKIYNKITTLKSFQTRLKRLHKKAYGTLINYKHSKNVDKTCKIILEGNEKIQELKSKTESV